MKHLFIPYELAVLAKEKGFNEPCFGYHNPDFGDESLGLSYPPSKHINDLDKKFPSAPLYQQIVDWFRDKHLLWIAIDRTDQLDNIWTIRGSEFKYGTNSNYYEALNKAIEEAFKLI